MDGGRRDGAWTLIATLALVGLCCLLSAGAAEAAQEAFVRVDQVGYPSLGSKRAYLMSNFDEAGQPFTVRGEGGQALFSGVVGASTGSWSKSFPDVYSLDFDALQATGEDTISVGGVVSPRFPVGAPASLYDPALARTLSFYENERDGPDYIPSPLRSAPGHLNDETAMTYSTPKVNREGEFKGDLASLGTTIDASGGWWDAGDYLKFVQTTSYTVDEMLAGIRDFPATMGASAPTGSSFDAEARFGLEWLLRMWNDETGTLYYQVGIGEGNKTTAGDHDIWRLPQADDSFGGTNPEYRYIRHRPVFRAGPPGSPVSPNLAGRDAAAFGECFQVFHESEPALADRCLKAGEHIFSLADTKPHGHLLTAIPFGFYPEKEWRDDLELGATELALALSSGATLPAGLAHTEASFYLADAAEWSKAYIKKAKHGSEGLNLYDVSGLADFDLARAMRAAGRTSGLAVSEASVVGDLDAKLEEAAAQSKRDPFGFGFPWAESDTASHGDGLAAMAGEYDWLTGSETFAADQTRWLGNVLGANAWGVSMIIGDGSTYPDCPSHQVANIVGSLDGSPPILAGAVVEGPSDEASSGFVEGMRACPPAGGDAYGRFDGSGAVFADDEQSYTTVEPAIDLTASSMLAFSWGVGSPSS
jgi:endoglucanase